MSKTDEVRLRHMLDAANQAIVFTQGRSRADLDTDTMLALAVVRLIEILGEIVIRFKNVALWSFKASFNLASVIPYQCCHDHVVQEGTSDQDQRG